MRTGSVLVALALVAPAASAGDRVSGTFGTEKGVVEIVDAWAYPGVSEFGGEPAIILRLSTVPIDAAPLADALDPEAVLDRVAAESPSIELEFDPAGRWRGSEYYLGSGNGCGFCSSPDAPGIAVKLEGGALRGTIRVKASDHEDGKGVVADLKLDVPVAAAPRTTALPADGGEPWRGFLACRTAIEKKDVAAFKASCAIQEEALASAEYHGTLDSFWESGMYGHPALELTGLKVTGGRATAGEAEVLLAGVDRDGNRHKAVVRLTKTPAGWRYVKGDVEAVYE